MTRNKRAARHWPPPRRGVILPIMLIALLVVALIGAAMTQTVLLQRRTARQAEQRQQAAWLADSALLRAQSRLAEDASYPGETWSISADELSSGHAASVVVRVETSGEVRRIVIEAAYPVDSLRRTLQHREKTVQLASPGGSS